MRKIVKICFISVLIVTVLVFTALGFYVGSLFSRAQALPLDTSALQGEAAEVAVTSASGDSLASYNLSGAKHLDISTLSDSTKNAFISIEDKEFYTHHGVNYKRLAKAALKNLATLSFKEGASTITQQLVKNTLLSSEKTLERKVTEIVLAKKIEDEFSKDEILQLYLNVIYFGSGCYGLASASEYYFSKEPADLSLEEAATLAGLIKSPSAYSPISQKEASEARRNLVLSQMQEDGFITESECLQAQSEPIKLQITPAKSNLNSYEQCAIDEAKRILNLSAKEIALRELKIHTYFDQTAQDALSCAVEAVSPNSDFCALALDNSAHGVKAFVGKSAYKILTAKRQPGSCIKPLLVYAPALNENIVSPITQISNEKTTINGYSPTNIGGKYSGYVSVREAVSRSINIPAVKVLSYVGLDKAKFYAQRMGIEFSEGDNSYALALGGMEYGVTPLDLASAYSCFARGGNFAKGKFISYISAPDGSVVYQHEPKEEAVLREDSSFLMTDMLKTSAKQGTAKLLSGLECEIASKTGTVGASGGQNRDAWNVSYTAAQTVCAWLGNLDNTPTCVAGGGAPTRIVKGYFESLGDSSHFEKPSSVTSLAIDSCTLADEHIAQLASPTTPEKYQKTELFSRFNAPKDISKAFTSAPKTKVKASADGDNLTLSFKAKSYVTYKVYAGGIDKELIATVQNKTGLQSVVLPCPQSDIYFVSEVALAKGALSSAEKISFCAKKWYE